MKEKGFTLIELLAVIVILAIIALIATPIVLNIIKDSKNSSIERSIELYGSAIEQAIARYQLNNSHQLSTGIYESSENGKTLTQNNNIIKVDYDGSPIDCKVRINKNGTIYLNKCIVNNEQTNYTYGTKIYDNGEIVYFNVDTGNICTDYKETNSKTGVKTGCMKFYAFNDNGGNKVNLILDHNTTATTAWGTAGDMKGSSTGPKEVIEQLKKDTSSWKGTELPTSYSIDQSYRTNGLKYVIDYSEYNARLITASEVAKITNNIQFNEVTASSHDDIFYFDSNTSNQSADCMYGNTIGCKYGWLYDRTGTDCTKSGCLNNSDVYTIGYWTASPMYKCAAWYVSSASIGEWGDFVDSNYGVRPVIEVLRSKLN